MALGYPHPDYLLRQITSLQLAEWEAYAMLEPFGSRNQEELFGKVCETVAKVFAKKKDNSQFTIDDFFPDKCERLLKIIETQDDGPVKQDVEVMRSILMSMATKPKDKKDILTPKKVRKGPQNR